MRGRALIALLTLATLVSGQERVWEQVGVANMTQVGGITAAIGDVDGDGYRDLATIQGAFIPVPQEYQIQIWIRSGRDGSALRVRPAFQRYTYWTLGSAGDADSDGLGDYVVTLKDQTISPGQRDMIVQVCSGRDDHVIWQVTNTWGSNLGYAVLGGLDVDGDHRPDVVMTAPTESSDGAVYAYSNRGQILYRVSGTPQLALGARSDPGILGRVGDVDGDGADDFVVGGADRTIPSGAAIVLSGRTGRVLVMGLDQPPAIGIGVAVDGCGDLDGDGVPDFVGGNSPQSSTVEGLVAVYSGRTGNPIRVWRSSLLGPSFSGSAVRGGLDTDLDGVPDIMTGNGSSFWVLSGRDGSVLHQQINQGGGIGSWPTAIGVQPGSQFPLFALSQGGYQPVSGERFNYRGRLLVYRGSPPSGEVFGIPCFGMLPAAPRVGLRSLAQSGVRITVHDGPPGPAALLLGLSRTQIGGQFLPYPLGAFGLPGCSLYVSPDLALVTDTGTSGLARGYAAVDLPLPIRATGTPLFAQWWCLGMSGPGAVSDAASFRF